MNKRQKQIRRMYNNYKVASYVFSNIKITTYPQFRRCYAPRYIEDELIETYAFYKRQGALAREYIRENRPYNPNSIRELEQKEQEEKKNEKGSDLE